MPLPSSEELHARALRLYGNEHWARLAERLAYAETVPLYAGRMAPDSGGMATGHLARFPITGKRELRAAFPKRGLPPGFPLREQLGSGALVVVSSGGAADDRLQTIQPAGWGEAQKRAALLLHAGLADAAGPGVRRAVLAAPRVAEGVCHAQDSPMEKRIAGDTLYLNRRGESADFTAAEVDVMLEELGRWRPRLLEADPVYLAPLARAMTAVGSEVHERPGVLLQWSFAAAPQLAAARAAFPVVARSAGGPETGLLFIECAAGRFHHEENGSALEMIPLAARPEGTLCRVLATTFAGPMPLVRYDTGMLVVLAADDSCSCGNARGWTAIALAGQSDEALLVTRAGGAELCTALDVDRALDAVAGLQLYRLVQEAADSFRLHAVVAPGAARDEVRAALRERATAGALVGAAARLEVDLVEFVPADLSGRYRAARCDAPDLAAGIRESGLASHTARTAEMAAR